MVVKERLDIIDCGRGKVFVRKRRDVKDRARGKLVCGYGCDDNTLKGGKGSFGTDVLFQIVQG